MSMYLSSSEALEKLCKSQPSKHVNCGIKKIVGGIALAGLSVGATLLGIKYFNMHSQELIDYYFDGCSKVVIWGTAIGSAIGAIRLFLDGSLSVTTQQHREDNFYYHNGGYTSTPNRASKIFGKNVKAAGSPNGLKERDCVLINAFTVTERGTSPDPSLSWKSEKERREVKYLRGSLNGEDLKVYLTPELDFESSLVEDTVEPGHILSVMGRVSDKSIYAYQIRESLLSN